MRYKRGKLITSLTPLTLKGGVVRVIDSATGDIARTTNGWIEDIKYGYFATLGTANASTEFDTAVLIDGHKTLKIENTDTSGKMTVDTAYSAGSTIPLSYQGSAKLIPVKSSTTYKLTFKYITNNRTSLSLGDILEYNSAGTRLTINAGTTVEGTHGETQTSVTITTQATTSGVVLRFGIKEGAIEQLWVGVGSMTLEEVTTITNPSSVSANLYPKVTAVTSKDNIDRSQTGKGTTLGFGKAGTNLLHAHIIAPTKKNYTYPFAFQKLASTGTFTGTVTVTLQAVTSYLPNGTTLATLKTFSNAEWEALSNSAETSINFPITMTPGTLYAVVFTPSTQDASNYPNVAGSATGGSTTGEGVRTYNGSAWVTNTTYIAYFTTYYSKNTTNATIRTDTATMSVTAPTTDGWAEGTVIDTATLGIAPLVLAPGVNNIYYSSNGPATADGTVDPSLQCIITPYLYERVPAFGGRLFSLKCPNFSLKCPNF